MTTSTDRIEKKVLLRAPRARVWRALSDAREFGTWFHAKVDGVFEPGAVIRGHSTAPGHEGVPLDFTVERMEPERVMSWRWRPQTLKPGEDPSSAPSTLTVFQLDDADGGTLLTIVESGFDSLPAAERAALYRGNVEGWNWQAENITRHVTQAA